MHQCSIKIMLHSVVTAASHTCNKVYLLRCCNCVYSFLATATSPSILASSACSITTNFNLNFHGGLSNMPYAPNCSSKVSDVKVLDLTVCWLKYDCIQIVPTLFKSW